MKTISIILFAAISQIILSQDVISEIQLTKDIKLICCAKIFNVLEHKIDTCNTGLGWLDICKIDGKPWFGCDAGLDLPDYELSRLSLEIASKFIKLDVSQMYNPAFKGILQRCQFKLSKIHEGYILYGYFSDGAGYYEAQWEIKKGNSKRTVLSKNESDFLMM
jgi:hypothetical protein